MDIIKYTFALIVFAWATVTPNLDTRTEDYTEPLLYIEDTSFTDMVSEIDSLENQIDLEVDKVRRKVITNHKTIVKYATEVDSMYAESLNK